jgi:hypothetical protein
MSGKTSRNKGSAFEREVAQAFTNTFNVSFRRTPLSGGWAKETIQGDITCGNPKFKLVVECKNHKTLWLSEWWKQVDADTPPDKIPVLIFKVSTRYHSTKTIKLKRDIEGSYTLLRVDDFNRIRDTTKPTEMDKKLFHAPYYETRQISIAKILHDLYMEDKTVALIGTDAFSGTLEVYVLMKTAEFLLNVNRKLCYNSPHKKKIPVKRRRRPK